MQSRRLILRTIVAAVRYDFPVDGDYFVKLFMLRTNVGLVWGPADPSVLEIRLNGEKLKEIALGASHGRGLQQDQDVDGTETPFTRTQAQG